jgi:hypothetical protein
MPIMLEFITPYSIILRLERKYEPRGEVGRLDWTFQCNRTRQARAH